MRLLVCLSFVFSSYCFGGEVFTELPERIDANAKFVFYSHGYIVEGDNPRPEHPRWGVYDYPLVKKVLSDDDYILVAHHRAEGTDPKLYARSLADDARKLIAAGVQPQNISFVGFSRGGVITIMVSNLLRSDEIRFAILAGCGGFIADSPDIEMHGDILSIRESSDSLVGSCSPLIERNESTRSFRELVISTGEEHGAFYKPLPVWVDPLKEWIKKVDED